MTSYDFLSPEWITAARALRDEYRDRLPPSTIEARVNVVVNEVPHGQADTVKGHIDTATGRTVIEEGHIDDADVTITIDYATARAAFVTRDQQELMQAFLAGKILVDGDATQLLALQSAPPEVDPAAIEMYERLDAMTNKDN